MDKRGQVYVLAAIVMSIIIFGMVSVSNKALQESVASDFERIANNYAAETAKLVNSLAGEQDILPAFRNFTLIFASYAKAQSPRFELISIFDYEDNLYIGNFLKERIIISYGEGPGKTILQPIEGCYSNVPAVLSFDGLSIDVSLNYKDVVTEIGCERPEIPSEAIEQITISIGNLAYKFDLRKEQPEIVIVGWETNAKQRKVFTKGSFIASAGDVVTLKDYCLKEKEECSKLPKSRYCNAGCSPKCTLISSEEECDANECTWSADTESCE